MLFLLFKTMRKVLHLSNYACGFSYCAPQKRKNTENSKNSSAEIFFRKKPEKNFSENFPKTQQKLCCIMFFGTHFQIISHIYLNKGKIVGSVKHSQLKMNKQKVSILVSAPSDNIPQLNCSIVFEELSRKVSVSRFKIIHRKTFTNSSICLLLSFAVGKKKWCKTSWTWNCLRKVSFCWAAKRTKWA